MNPQHAYQDDEDDAPQIRPRLGLVQGEGEGTPKDEREKGHLRSVPTGGGVEDESDGEGESAEGLKAMEGGGESSPRSKGHLKAVDSDGLKASEEDADAMNYTGDKKKGGKKKLKAKQWWTKKKVGIAGGILGTGLAGGIFGLSIISGPFEIIHIAQLMQKSHFSNLTDASDSRMGKLYRYINSGGDASQTRLGWLANKYKNTMLGQLEDKGMSPATGRFATLEGWNIDPGAKSENNPFKGMNESEINDYLIKSGVPEGSFSIAAGEGGKFVVSANKGGLNFLKTYQNQKGMLQFMVGQADESKIPNALRWRWLGKAFGVTWHPFIQLKGALDNKVNDVLLKGWKAAREKLLKTGTGGTDIVDAANADQQGTDSKGNTTNTQVDGGTVNSESGFSKGLQNIKDAAGSPGGKIAGGLAAAIGIICLFKSVSNNIGDIRYTQAIIPMMRLGAETVIEGEQIMMNKDVDLSEMGVIAQQFYDAQQKLDWSDSQPVQADSGLPQTGQDVNGGIKGVLNETPPAWLAWTDNAVVGTVCSTGGQVITGIVSFALGVFSGELASTAIQAVAGALVMPEATSFLTKLATNNIVDVTKVVGPQFGGVVDYGTRLWSNSQAVGLGATQIPDAVAAGMVNQDNIQETQQFEHQSLAYRLFDPYDYRSLFSKVLDNTAPTPAENTVNLADAVMGMGHTLATLPMNLFSTAVHADTVTTYKYPFAVWGFTPQDLTNPLIANPYDNGQAVAQMLDNNNQNGTPDYIGKADKCFGVSIEKITETDGKQDWDVIPNGVGVNLYNNTANTSDYYNAADCNNPSNISHDDWLRLRYFVFDTGMMEGWACEHGDDQSCTNDGVNTNTATVSTPVGGGLTINDAAAQKVIAQSGATVGYAIYDTDNNPIASFQGDTQNYGASITKSMLLVAYLRQVGSGTLTAQAKTELTNMIENSDNNSANWVYKQLKDGPTQVMQVATDGGMTNFSFDTSDPTYTLGQSQVTANDFAKFFAKIDTLMPDTQKSYGMNLLAHLSSADQTGLLQAGLPGTVYSKEGWKPEPAGTTGSPYVVNQAAQFSQGGASYGIAVTVGHVRDQATGENLIKQVVAALLNTNGN